MSKWGDPVRMSPSRAAVWLWSLAIVLVLTLCIATPYIALGGLLRATAPSEANIRQVYGYTGTDLRRLPEATLLPPHSRAGNVWISDGEIGPFAGRHESSLLQTFILPFAEAGGIEGFYAEALTARGWTRCPRYYGQAPPTAWCRGNLLFSSNEAPPSPLPGTPPPDPGLLEVAFRIEARPLTSGQGTPVRISVP